MAGVKIEIEPMADADELLALYGSVGWTAYTDNRESLLEAIRRSTLVVTARDEGELVGIARCLTDSVSVWYLQDVIVHPDYQRRGIGTALFRECLAPFPAVRTRVLLTDAEPRQRAFYESLGLVDVSERPELRVFLGP
jgi:ribosomal protein S18 acetylase RimI-like enzyme